jgi:phospholipid/cholesterol/gamma-HCH transport system permease protein
MNNQFSQPIIVIGRFAIHHAKQSARILLHIARLFHLMIETVFRIHLVYKNIEMSIEQMYKLGVQSLPLVLCVSVFIGAEVVLQANFQFSGIIPLKFLGMAACKTIITEFAPVFTSIIFAGRVATSIAAEISNMKSSEQIEAMYCLNLDPIRYLVVPRIMACMIMLPALVVFAGFIAIVSSIFTAAMYVNIPLGQYISSLGLYFNYWDVVTTIAKTILFAFSVGILGIYQGFASEKSAVGVGKATSSSIMVVTATILFLDFLLNMILL